MLVHALLDAPPFSISNGSILHHQQTATVRYSRISCGRVVQEDRSGCVKLHDYLFCRFQGRDE